MRSPVVCAQELFPGSFAPTPTHYFMRLLHKKGLLQRCFTQVRAPGAACLWLWVVCPSFHCFSSLGPLVPLWLLMFMHAAAHCFILREFVVAIESCAHENWNDCLAKADPPHARPRCPTINVYPARPSLAAAPLALKASPGALSFPAAQNIDSLEHQAGLPKETVVAAHGNFDSAHCIRCGRPHSVEHVRAAVFAGDGNPCYCSHKVGAGAGALPGRGRLRLA